MTTVTSMCTLTNIFHCKPIVNKEYMKEEKEIIIFTSRFKKEIYDKAKKMANVRGMSLNQFLMFLVYQNNE